MQNGLPAPGDNSGDNNSAQENDSGLFDQHDGQGDDLLFLGNTVYRPLQGAASSAVDDGSPPDVYAGESRLLGNNGHNGDEQGDSDALTSYVLGNQMQTPVSGQPDSGQKGKTAGQIPPGGLTVSAGAPSADEGGRSPADVNWFTGKYDDDDDSAPKFGIQTGVKKPEPQDGGQSYNDGFLQTITGGRPFTLPKTLDSDQPQVLLNPKWNGDPDGPQVLLNPKIDVPTAQSQDGTQARQRAYTYDPQTDTLQYKPGDLLKGIRQAHEDGLLTSEQMEVLYPQAQKINQLQQEILQLANRSLRWNSGVQDSVEGSEAELVGLGRGVVVAGGSLTGAGLGAAYGIESGPGALWTSLIGGVTGGYLSGKAYDEAIALIGQYNSMVRDFNAAAAKFPVAAGTGEIIGGFLPGLLTPDKVLQKGSDFLKLKADKLAFDAIQKELASPEGAVTPAAKQISGRLAKYFNATADALEEHIGGPARGINDLIEQSRIQLATPGQTGWNVASTIAREAILRAGVSVAVDTALKSLPGQGGQTYGGALQAALVGALWTGHGTKFTNFEAADLGDIILRGELHERGGASLAEDMNRSQIANAARLKNISPENITPGYAQGLSEQEQEVYNTFKQQIANGSIPVDPHQVALTARQAFGTGQQKNISVFMPPPMPALTPR